MPTPIQRRSAVVVCIEISVLRAGSLEVFDPIWDRPDSRVSADRVSASRFGFVPASSQGSRGGYPLNRLAARFEPSRFSMDLAGLRAEQRIGAAAANILADLKPRSARKVATFTPRTSEAHWTAFSPVDVPGKGSPSHLDAICRPSLVPTKPRVSPVPTVAGLPAMQLRRHGAR